LNACAYADHLPNDRGIRKIQRIQRPLHWKRPMR
jgi:hypothetical protein